MGTESTVLAHSATAQPAMDVHKALSLLTTAASAIPEEAKIYLDVMETSRQSQMVCRFRGQ